MPNENTGGRNLIIAIIVIVVLAIIAAIWFSVRGPASDEVTNPTELGFPAAQEANATGTLEVGPQLPGTAVFVAQANLPAGGWVVVRENNAGVPGAVLGSSFFSANTRLGNIDLTAPTVEGQTYFVEVYTDDGDGQFNLAKDALVMSRANAPLRVQFTATRDLPEVKG